MSGPYLDTTMDEHGNHNGSHGTNVQPARRWSKPLNESWPPPEVAKRLRDVELEDQIPVTVRLVFETGEEHVDGIATRWAKDLPHVRVAINDQRLSSGGVWLAPADVRRR